MKEWLMRYIIDHYEATATDCGVGLGRNHIWIDRQQEQGYPVDEESCVYIAWLPPLLWRVPRLEAYPPHEFIFREEPAHRGQCLCIF